MTEKDKYVTREEFNALAAEVRALKGEQNDQEIQKLREGVLRDIEKLRKLAR